MDFLTKQHQIFLLKLARQRIADYFGLTNSAKLEDPEENIFKKKRGVFVTLHLDGHLRGCLGYLRGVNNLLADVGELSLAAAFEDSRFRPLSPEEYPQIDIELSVLTPFQLVSDPQEIIIGKDGLIITQDHNSGLLLPQVASENNWDVKTFLEQTCYKAGLNLDAWQKPQIKIEKFQAQVFGEKDLD